MAINSLISLHKQRPIGYIENTSCHVFTQFNYLPYTANLKDNNGMFRNSLNSISAGLAEAALLLLHFKDTLTIVFYISLKTTNCERRLNQDTA